MDSLLIVTDAWEPQVNGVVRTLRETKRELETRGCRVGIIGPHDFRTIGLPFYSEIRLAIAPALKLERMISDFAPGAVHLPTEGPLGWAARRLCHSLGLPFTTAVHTRFAEYLSSRLPVPQRLGYAAMRRFHEPSSAVMVATDSLAQDLDRRGFANLCRWTRGVDLDTFQPTPGGFPDLPRPIMLYAGRVAVEKNLPAFLELDLPGTKVVVGDGPQLPRLRQRHKTVVFTGALQGGALASAYSAADVFVFPSRTDTFGLVVAEALACGTPVAAYPVPGPGDVLADQSPERPVGVLDSDLAQAIRRTLALNIPAERCRDFVAKRFTWNIATTQFQALAFPARKPVAQNAGYFLA